VLYDWLFIVVSGLDTLIIGLIVFLIIRVQRGEILVELKAKKATIAHQCKQVISTIKRRKKS
jgi:hypothetical protein